MLRVKLQTGLAGGSEEFNIWEIECDKPNGRDCETNLENS